MGVIVKGNAVLEDPESGDTVTISNKNLDFYSECHDGDRKMGEEIAHIAKIEINVGGRPHEVRWVIYEYPVGSLNHVELDSGVLEVIQDFVFDIQMDSEFYED